MPQSFPAIILLACGLMSIVPIRFWTTCDSGSDLPRLPGPHSSVQLYSIWARSFGGLFEIKGALFHPDIIIAPDHAAGLVWAEGDDWHRQRKILSPAFSQESVKGMTPAIYDLVLLDFSSKNGRTPNIVHYVSACTLDIIGMVGLSHSVSSTNSGDESDAAQISASLTHLVNAGLRQLAFIATVVVRAIPIVTCAPLLLLHNQGVVKSIVERIGQKILDRERTGNGSKGERESKDIIGLLLQARRGSQETLTDTHLLDNVPSPLALLGGHETTASSITFTLWELARQPAIQNRLRAEIQKLEFLDAVVKEAPQTERVALRDDIIPLSRPRPPTLPHGWSGLLTFCDGRRNCVGWRLGVFEFKIILATLVRLIVFLDTGVMVEKKVSPRQGEKLCTY
ncbi:cytochrome P450 [Mycena crocata]|nr:cytochrome P450 [Mycena crocata]